MKSLKIYGWDVGLQKVKGLMQQSPYAGYYDPNKKLIVVDASLKGDDYICTLIHEVIHALFHRAGLHQTKIPSAVEEMICEQVATVITENFSVSAKRKR